mmetsp:Transcript_43611/g.138867  ORF Transcript_43611/g.138867 Transcript_43611/m.138867 type:complete len:251 (+) Transcript_43611:353-1105(+)
MSLPSARSSNCTVTRSSLNCESTVPFTPKRTNKVVSFMRSCAATTRWAMSTPKWHGSCGTISKGCTLRGRSWKSMRSSKITSTRSGPAAPRTTPGVPNATVTVSPIIRSCEAATSSQTWNLPGMGSSSPPSNSAASASRRLNSSGTTASRQRWSVSERGGSRNGSFALQPPGHRATPDARAALNKHACRQPRQNDLLQHAKVTGSNRVSLQMLHSKRSSGRLSASGGTMPRERRSRRPLDRSLGQGGHCR